MKVAICCTVYMLQSIKFIFGFIKLHTVRHTFIIINTLMQYSDPFITSTITPERNALQIKSSNTSSEFGANLSKQKNQFQCLFFSFCLLPKDKWNALNKHYIENKTGLISTQRQYFRDFSCESFFQFPFTFGLCLFLELSSSPLLSFLSAFGFFLSIIRILGCIPSRSPSYYFYQEPFALVFRSQK